MGLLDCIGKFLQKRKKSSICRGLVYTYMETNKKCWKTIIIKIQISTN